MLAKELSKECGGAGAELFPVIDGVLLEVAGLKWVVRERRGYRRAIRPGQDREDRIDGGQIVSEAPLSI